MGYGYSATGHAPGAWTNATDGGDLSEPYLAPGLPAGPDVVRRLGANGNITDVTWRVDGGDVREVNATSFRAGRLVSPEYVAFWFEAGDGEAAGRFHGSLDPARTAHERVETIEDFLEAVRPGREDNRQLAEELEPHSVPLQFNMGMPVKTPADAPRDPPPPAPLVVGGFVVAASLTSNLSKASFEDDFLSTTFASGAWQWNVRTAVASNQTYPPEAKWDVSVDARDWINVYAVTAAELNESALVEHIKGLLAGHNVTVPPDDWRISAHGPGTGIFCPPQTRPLPES